MAMNYDGIPGDYTYSQNHNGKAVGGVVKNGPTSNRDPAAQRSAGGTDRQPGDQGGHLLGHRFGGRNDSSNLDAQAANVNQKDQANVERNVSNLAANPNNTLSMNVTNFNSVGERPDATMINVGVKNNATGKIDEQHVSFQNASHDRQESWNDSAAIVDPTIDPSQNAGMTEEQRGAANGLCGAENIVDDRLGSGWTYTDFDSSFLDAGSNGTETATEMGDEVSAVNESEDSMESDSQEGAGIDGGTSDDDGLSE